MKKQSDSTAAERLERYRANAAAKGLKRRDYYATPEEHEKLTATLERMRKKSGTG